jgi:hypothetical protein
MHIARIHFGVSAVFHRFKAKVFLISLALFFVASLYGQIGYGITAKTDLYARYSNPKDGIASPSAGSALLNIGVGPKLWFGGDYVSFSPEASVIFSPFALSVGDFKGMGAASFPVMGKFHFLGMSNLNKDGLFGFALGFGVQWSRTELYGLKESFDELGVERSFFKTYVIELDYGFGLSGFNLHGFVRYGFNDDLQANTLNIGVGYDFNFKLLKEATDPDF